MPHLEDDSYGDDSKEPPEGYEGHTSTGAHCLRCGVSLRGKHWVKVHDAWHKQLDER